MQMMKHMPLKVDADAINEPQTKAHLLLQSHFGRSNLTADLASDRRDIVERSLRLLQACVDVISSNGWLTPAIQAMEVSQMVVQGMWDKDSQLLQLPHFDKKLAKRCEAAGVEGVFDLMDMEEAERHKLLQLSPQALADVARVCNRFPNVEVTYELSCGDVAVQTGDSVKIKVQMEREMVGTDKVVPPVFAPHFPKPKEEGWWLVIGEPATNTLLSVKRVNLGVKSVSQLDFTAPDAGRRDLKLFFMCDSWIGCDQEFDISLTVEDAMDQD